MKKNHYINTVKEYRMILLLNSDFLPIAVIPFKRAIKLLFKGKADMIISEGNPIQTTSTILDRPSVIRLKRYANVPYRKIILTRHNLFKRDGHKCGYCASKEQLTVDHIIPKSRGGKNTWTNLVTCCSKCNRKKDDRTPDEAGMNLLVHPYVPNNIGFIAAMNKHKTLWEPFLFHK